MVKVFDAKEAVTPAGKFVGVPIPVKPLVVCVIGVITVLIQGVGLDEAAEIELLTVIKTGVEYDVHQDPN